MRVTSRRLRSASTRSASARSASSRSESSRSSRVRSSESRRRGSLIRSNRLSRNSMRSRRLRRSAASVPASRSEAKGRVFSEALSNFESKMAQYKDLVRRTARKHHSEISASALKNLVKNYSELRSEARVLAKVRDNSQNAADQYNILHSEFRSRLAKDSRRAMRNSGRSSSRRSETRSALKRWASAMESQKVREMAA